MYLKQESIMVASIFLDGKYFFFAFHHKEKQGGTTILSSLVACLYAARDFCFNKINPLSASKGGY